MVADRSTDQPLFVSQISGSIVADPWILAQAISRLTGLY